MRQVIGSVLGYLPQSNVFVSGPRFANRQKLAKSNLTGTAEKTAASPPTVPASRVGGSLILFILSALLLTGGLGMTMLDRFSKSADVGLDSGVWLFAQVEVDAKTFALTVLSATQDKPGTDLINDSAIRRTFDIFYSRIETASNAAKDLFPATTALAEINELQTASANLAMRLDATPTFTADFGRRMYEQFSGLLPKARKIANAAMIEAVTTRENERATRQWIMKRFLALMGIVVVLMTASVWQAMRILRAISSHAAESANTTKQLLRTFNASLDAVVGIDFDGLITHHNDALRRMLGIAPGIQIAGTNIHTFLLPEERASLDVFVDALIAESALASPNLAPARQIDLSFRTVSGKIIPVEMSCAADQEADGRFSYIVFIRDRSREVEAADELRKSRDLARQDAKAKERFLSVLSHEMRTPLHGVMASLELINDTHLNRSEKEFLSTAQACAKTALTQVDDVLALTRNGHLGDITEPFSPETLIDEIVGEMFPLALEKQNLVTFQTEGLAKGAALLGKPRSFKLSVRNLISNAIKYTEHGRIDICLAMHRLESGMALARVSVQDTGIGICPADQAHIFEEFAVVAEKDVEKHSGFGLGLAIAKSSVERMQGHISVTSEMGKGSCFAFEFQAEFVAPEVIPQPAPKGPQVAAVDPAAARHVLIVDDNPVNRALLSEMVSRLGHIAEVATDGTTAVNLALIKSYDLILMDLSMPGISGFEAAQAIRSEGCNMRTHITALTARDLAECQDQITASGMQSAAQKPISMKALQDLLTQTGDTPAAPAAGKEWSNLPLLEGFSEVEFLMGRKMLKNIAAAMIAESQAALAQIEAQEWKEGQMAQFIETVHRASGSAAILGARRLAEVWRDIETAACKGTTNQLEALAALAPEVFAATVEVVQAEIA